MLVMLFTYYNVIGDDSLNKRSQREAIMNKLKSIIEKLNRKIKYVNFGYLIP